MSNLRLPPLPTIKEILKIYKLRAMKQLSQNFLLDEKLTDKIIRKAGDISGGHVLEVGPGPGALTRSIMRQQPKRLIVVEKDKRFEPTLDMLADCFATVNGRMDIIYDDIMKVPLDNLFPDEEKVDWTYKPPNIHIIGNLPFSISTPLIIKWLHAIAEKRGPWAYGRTKLTLTFQKEVAERLVAPPGDSQRCRLSVMAQTWTFPILRFVIPGKAFLPKPDVDVGVVTFVPLVNPHTQHDFLFFEKINRHIFSFRQKYNIRCIQTLFPLECRQEMSELIFKLSDLDPKVKAMQWTVQDINKLVTAYKYILDKHPELGLYNYRASKKLLHDNYSRYIEVEEYIE